MQQKWKLIGWPVAEHEEQEHNLKSQECYAESNGQLAKGSSSQTVEGII